MKGPRVQVSLELLVMAAWTFNLCYCGGDYSAPVAKLTNCAVDENGVSLPIRAQDSPSCTCSIDSRVDYPLNVHTYWRDGEGQELAVGEQPDFFVVLSLEYPKDHLKTFTCTAESSTHGNSEAIQYTALFIHGPDEVVIALEGVENNEYNMSCQVNASNVYLGFDVTFHLVDHTSREFEPQAVPEDQTTGVSTTYFTVTDLIPGEEYTAECVANNSLTPNVGTSKRLTFTAEGCGDVCCDGTTPLCFCLWPVAFVFIFALQWMY